MSNLLYSLPEDNIAALVAPTVDGGAEDPTYPAVNLVDMNPAKPSKLLGTTGAFLWAFPAAKRVDIFAVIHHNLVAGLSIKIQANATDVWTSPSLDVSVTVPAWWADGMPVNILKDLTGETGYVAGGYKYWRLVIESANTDPIAIGEVMIIQTRRLWTDNVEWGLALGEERPLIEHITDYMVSTVYYYGSYRREISGSLKISEAGVTELRAWYRACGGRAIPFLLQMQYGEEDDCWMARFKSSSLNLTWDAPNIYQGTIAFEEVVRGLPL